MNLGLEYKIYNFDETERQLNNEQLGEKFIVKDYFQYYTTGIESIVKENENDFEKIKRQDNERSEVITYNLYQDANASDVIVSINNDVYLWDAPFVWDTLDFVVKNKMTYVQKVFKSPMLEDDYRYWERNIISDVIKTRDIQSTVVVPKREYIQKTIRKIKRYLKERTIS